jgi:hypothetical protein
MINQLELVENKIIVRNTETLFITAPLVKRGRDQHVAILLLLLLLLLQSSIGPIRAKQIA